MLPRSGRGCNTTGRRQPGVRLLSVVCRHCTCIPEEHDHGMGKLTVRAGLPGVTIFAPVPRAPALDLYPGRLATTDAQQEVAPRAPIQVPAGVVMARATREDRTMADETIHWFAGVDWGSAKHQVCLLDGAGKVVGEREFAHSGAGLAALCEWVVSMAGDPGTIAMAIEVPHGPVVDTLLDRGFAVYAINPKQP